MMRKIYNILLLLVLLSGRAWGYGPIYLTESGVSLTWDTATDIQLHVESGDCSIISNADMVDRISSAIDVWTGLTEVSLGLDVAEGEIGSVDDNNYSAMLDDADNAEKNPITFDEGGDIISSLFGESNRYNVLGFSEIIGTNDTEITRANFLINCTCLEGGNDGCGFESELVLLDEVILHEMGHLLNLDHTQVNDELSDAVTSNDQDDLPTMYPISVFPEEQANLQQDDVISLATLYPADTFASTYCHVTGSVLDSTSNPLRCADVQAVAADAAETTAYISGTNAPATDDNGDADTADDGECQSDCGDFSLYLKPGVDYTLMLRPVNPSFVNGSGLGPCYTGQLTTVDEEELTTIAAASCVAGTALDLGELTTQSTGGTATGGIDTGSDDEDTGGTGGHGGGIQRVMGCALDESGELKRFHVQGLLFPAGLLLLLLVFKRKFLS